MKFKKKTVSISNNEGSYRKSYGKVYSKGNVTTTEINESLQLASASTISNSTHEYKGNGYSESLEKVHGVINTESLARTESREDIHTETVEIYILSDNNGNLSNYCINVGQSRDNKSYYLSISKCSHTSYLLENNVSFTDYEKSINPFINEFIEFHDIFVFTGFNICIYLIIFIFHLKQRKYYNLH